MPNGNNYPQSDKSGKPTTTPPNQEDMTKEQRERLVLAFMAEYPLPFEPRMLYRAMRLRRDVTFSYRSIHRYLETLEEKGWVQRVEKEPLDRGEIVEAGEDSRAAFIITDEGRAEIESE